MMKWKIPYAYVPGTRHSQDEVECQDYALAKLSDGFACVVVADGAGSVANAGQGAKLACEITRDFLFDININLFSMNPEEIKEELITEIRIQLHAAAREMKCEFESFASTLLFFATDGVNFLAGNVGDGLVGVIDEHNHASTLLVPENGNFLNESFFVTDDDCKSHLRFLYGKFSQSSIYFLMTDGSCDCLYNRREKTFASALDVFADWMRRYDDHRLISSALRDTMFRLFRKATSDDCALAFISGLIAHKI